MVRGRAGVAGRGGGAPEGALLHHFQFSGAGGGARGARRGMQWARRAYFHCTVERSKLDTNM